jgi:hypothetical protein
MVPLIDYYPPFEINRNDRLNNSSNNNINNKNNNNIIDEFGRL